MTVTQRCRRLLTTTGSLLCAAFVVAIVVSCSGLEGEAGPTPGESTPAPSGTAPGGPSGPPSTDKPPPTPTVDEALEDRYQKVVSDVLPSVVQITTEEELGSGVIYDKQGHIVTNAHVVGSTKKFEVALATGGQPLRAELVAAYKKQDLAVIKLTDPPKRLRPGVFGDSAKVAVGQVVLAMGNPLGLSSSVTQGIVSAVGRSVTEGEGATIGNMVQTSAAINPGNSGGALVNLSGQVVGIPTLAARDPQLGSGPAPGIGFAIPAATVRNLAGQMIEHGKVVDPNEAALGVSVRTILGEKFRPAGASVVKVVKDGPADRAGVRPGDLLVRMGTAEITDVMTLAEALAGHQPGDKVELGLVRADKQRSVRVTLGES